MNLLLDTHVLIWATSTFSGEGSPMSARADALIDDPGNRLHFSVASIWEVAIKAGLTRSNFRVDPRTLRRSLLENAYVEVPVEGEHALSVARLPSIHRDPFDRLLIAQAKAEGLTLLTADATVARYGGRIELV